MPEIVDEDESSYFVVPDLGGEPIRVTKSPEVLAALGITPPASQVSAEQPASMPVEGDAISGFASSPSEVPTPDFSAQPSSAPVEQPSSMPAPDGAIGPAGPVEPVPNPNLAPPVSIEQQVANQKPVLERTALEAKQAAALPQPVSVIEPAPNTVTPPAPAQTTPATPDESAMKKAEQDKLAAMKNEQKAAGELARLAEHAADERAFAMISDSLTADKFAAAQAEKERIRKDALDMEMGRLDVLQKRARDSKIDPDHVWKQKGAGARIVAILGQALGAFGAAMTGGGENYAAKLVEDMVRSDILAQKEEIQRKGEDVDQQRNTIAMMRQNGFDEAQSDSAAYIVQMEAAKKKLEAAVAADAPMEVRQRAAALSAQFDQKIANERQRFIVASQPKALSLMDELRLREFTQKVNDEANKLRLPFLGPDKYALNERVAKIVEDGYRKHQEMLAPVNDMKAILKRAGTEAFSITDNDATQLQQLGQFIALKLKNSEELGTLDKGSQEVLDKMVGDPTSLVGSGKKVLGLIRTIERMSAKKYSTALKVGGFNDEAAIVESSAEKN